MNTSTKSAKSIFLEAVESYTPDQWKDYLNTACPEDTTLRRRVEALLKSHQESDSMLDQSFPHTDVSGADAEANSVIGPYKLLQQLGEGGFGIVYMAEQQEPVRRYVALKIIKAGMDTRAVVARFEAERQALALMDHPNIARVLDAGATDSGRPYFVMDLVKGVPITEYCDKNHLSARERLELFMTVCHAVQHAHQKGVIHRDLKPANIMVTLHDGKAIPKVIDFGVSKAISQRLTEKTLFTAYGQLLGTPQYMSPEQAEMSGLDVDTRSDVYSLGVLLYELLTGKTPLESDRLRSASYSAVQRMICDVQPPKPSTRLSTLGTELTVIAKQRSVEPKRLRQLIRGELDWIVMRSLEKDRGRRYESASSFAADILRFLSNETVVACPPSAAYQLRKFVRRHKGLVAAVLAISIALVAGVIGTTFGLVRAEREASVAKAETARANKARVDAQKSEDAARNEAERNRRLLYVSDMAGALHAWQEGNAGRVAQLLKGHLPHTGQEDLRGFEWYYLFRQCQRTLKTPTLKECGNTVTFSPDGKSLATGDGPDIKFWDLWSREVVGVLKGHGAAVTCATFSPDGETLASTTSDGVIKLWDINALNERATICAVDRHVYGLDFSPDGKILASCDGSDYTIQLWDVETARHFDTLDGHSGPVSSVAYSPDGETLASSSWDGTIKLWDLEDRKHKSIKGNGGNVYCVAFSADGKVVASGHADRSVKLWDAVSGALSKTLTGHGQSITSVVFSPDGKTLASGGVDNTVRLWDLDAAEVYDVLRGTGVVSAVAFSLDGKTLAAATNNTTMLWDTSKRPDRDLFHTHDSEITQLAFLPNGRTLASGSWDGTIKLQDVNTGQQRSLPTHDHAATVKFSPDGRTLAASGAEDTIVLWDPATGDKQLTLRGHEALVWYFVFSPDSRVLASGGLDQTVRLWDVASGKETHKLERFPGSVRCVDFSPDGKTVAFGNREGTIALWDPSTGGQRTITSGAPELWTVVFSPDGQTLAATTMNSVKRWDVATGQELVPLAGHTAMVMHVAYSQPDGKTLASTSWDGSVKLWDAATGALRCTLPRYCGEINHLVFSLDGTTMAMGGRDGTIRLWRAATEEDVRAAQWHQLDDGESIGNAE